MMLSEPIVGEQFFGRREVIDHIRKRVDALKEGYRQNIALTGQNLAGKTSILHNFLYAFSDSQILPIYVEIADEPFEYFSRRFMGSLLYNFLKTKECSPEEDLPALIEKARQYIPRSVKSVADIQECIKKRNYDEAYSLLFDLTAVIKEETGKSCVIILDEFHNLASLNVRHPFRNFGRKIMIQKDTMYIVTSSQVTTVKKILDEKLSLLFGNFEIIEVGGFSVKNGLTFLNQRFKYIRFPDEHKYFILALTEGNPFYLDVISEAIKEIVLQMTFKRVTEEVVIEALERCIFNAKGCISQYLNNSLEAVRLANSSETLLSILLAAAGGKRRIKEISKAVRKRSSDVSKYAAELLEMNMLYKNGTIFNFVDSMLGFWLKFVYEKRRSAIITYLPDRIEIFRSDMRALLSRFLAEERREIMDRVADLLKAFDNETLFILDKECRLPPFESVETGYFENGVPHISAKTNNGLWIAAVSADELRDIDIIEFVERCKNLKTKIQRKILIALSDIDTNGRLMAKEENIWLWDSQTLNKIMALFGKEPVISYIHQKRKRVLA